jgi:uncharacterized membrane protein YbhN (UPF0104 family)
MQADAAIATGKKPAAWKVAVNIALLVLLVGVFARQIIKDWPLIATYPFHPNWGLVAAAVGLLLVCSLLDIAIWNTALGWFTDRLPFRLAAPVYMWSTLARYIPGKVASLVVRVTLAAEADRPAVPVLAASGLELVLRTCAALLTVIPILPWLGLNIRIPLPVLIGLVPFVLLCAHPRIMLPVMNVLLKKMKRQPITRKVRYRDVLGLFGSLVVRWLLYGMAFALLVMAVYPKAAQDVVLLVSTAAGSWAAGFVIPAPGGVGVAEHVQRLAMQHAGFREAVADVMPVIFRLTTLFTEGLWALAGIALWRGAMASVEVEAETDGVQPPPYVPTPE